MSTIKLYVLSLSLHYDEKDDDDDNDDGDGRRRRCRRPFRRPPPVFHNPIRLGTFKKCPPSNIV